MPPIDELLGATIIEPLYWYPVVNVRKTRTQNDTSYEEQLFTIKVCPESINVYLYFMTNGFMKIIIIALFPDSEKDFSWCTL